MAHIAKPVSGADRKKRVSRILRVALCLAFGHKSSGLSIKRPEFCPRCGWKCGEKWTRDKREEIR